MRGRALSLPQQSLNAASRADTVVKWACTGTPIGWRKELLTRGVFPQTWEDTAAVKKSESGGYHSFFGAGEHAEQW